MNNKKPAPTAAMLAIGDELLSGRTRDKNIGHLANALTQQGIDLKEVRIVSDEEVEIASAVNALRERYDYVFTSGGIGPTHDDITADAIGAALGLQVVHDPRAMELLEKHYSRNSMDFTTARKRMARMPTGSGLIDNPVSMAPGFVIENVYVMAGVPAVFQAMVENVLQTLEGGQLILSETVVCPYGEGTIGDELGEIQKANHDTSIGSYPKFEDGKFYTNIVIRSRDSDAIKLAKLQVEKMLADIADKS